MTVWDVIAILAALWLGCHMREIFADEMFAEWMRSLRPTPHEFR